MRARASAPRGRSLDGGSCPCHPIQGLPLPPSHPGASSPYPIQRLPPSIPPRRFLPPSRLLSKPWSGRTPLPRKQGYRKRGCLWGPAGKGRMNGLRSELCGSRRDLGSFGDRVRLLAAGPTFSSIPAPPPSSRWLLS